MDIEDLEPRPQQPALKPLDGLGIAELNAYIAWLEGEIARTRAVIAAKEKARLGAASAFNR